MVETKLTKPNKTCDSLRVSLPMGIIKQLGLKEGDKLAWQLVVNDGKIELKATPVKN
ncbi:AbrB/MazE/SpoVT family DNA-binding domain-containing protein [Halobacteriota archaeon]